MLGTTFKPASAKLGGQLLDLWLHQYLRPKLDFRFLAFEFRGLPVVLLRVPAAVGPVKVCTEDKFNTAPGPASMVVFM